MTVLPQITGRLTVPDPLSTAHPERLEAERGQRQEVVRPLVETADIVVPAALCEIVYEIPIAS